MIFSRLAATIFGSALVIRGALALGLSAPHASFGGVNYPGLAFLEPEERDAVITKLVNANVSVIRLVISGNEKFSDVEANLGIFDEGMMNRYDDTLWSIYRISKGKTKVIIAPHNVHNLRGTNGAVCDAYCKKLGDAWLDFYTVEEMRSRYKMRLGYILGGYMSKRFRGAQWVDLEDVILGVDLQNEPFGGVWPIPAGESWICELAEHLKKRVGLGRKNIAVISGGVSGAQSADGEQNMPWSVWKCDAIDIIGIHGYYSSSDEESAGTTWARRFAPGAEIPARALARGKLVLVEEFSYVESANSVKSADIWDQAEALNFRGIPWLYASVTNANEVNSTSEVKFRGTKKSPIAALRAALAKANKSPSMFDWSHWLKRQTLPTPHTAVAPNPWQPYQQGCTFGCLGWLCDAMDGCSSDLVCQNNICSPCTIGCPGMACDASKSPCQEPYQCVGGTCQECSSRDELAELHGTCESTGTQCTKEFFPTTPICGFCDKRTQACRGAPCERASDCDTTEVCEWGLCKPCKEGCIGEPCKTSKSCNSGHCTDNRVCDYPPKQAKRKAQEFAGRRGPCGPGQDCRRGRKMGFKPQPVLHGNAHSRGAGERAANAAAATPTAT